MSTKLYSKTFIDHKDGNMLNNAVSNLREWIVVPEGSVFSYDEVVSWAARASHIDIIVKTPDKLNKVRLFINQMYDAENGLVVKLTMFESDSMFILSEVELPQHHRLVVRFSDHPYMEIE